MPKHFCCCLSLKTGAVLMAFLNLLEGLAETITAIVELSSLEEKYKIHTLTKRVNINIVGKVCNATKFCNETKLDRTFPTGQPGVEGNATLFIACLIVGILSILSGILLLIGLLQAKEKYVLWFLLLGSISLFIVTVYSGINMFHNGLLFLMFIISLIMLYGHLSMYYFYEEISEYNTVKSGVIEIAYNGEDKSYISSMAPNGTIDNTAV